MRKSAASILVLATTLFLTTGGNRSAAAADSNASPPAPPAPTEAPSNMVTPAPGQPGSDIPIDKDAGKDGNKQIEVIMLPTSSTTLQGGATKKHHKHPVATYLKDSTAGLGFSLGMLLGPDSDDRAPDTSFSKLTTEQKRTAHIVWSDGSQTIVKPTPDGGFTLVGGDSNGTTLKPMEGGGFLVVNSQGRAGKLLPMPGGGFQLSLAGGDTLTLSPRTGGGFNVDTSEGELGQIIPGAGMTKYGFYDNSFFQ